MRGVPAPRAELRTRRGGSRCASAGQEGNPRPTPNAPSVRASSRPEREAPARPRSYDCDLAFTRSNCRSNVLPPAPTSSATLRPASSSLWPWPRRTPRIALIYSAQIFCQQLLLQERVISSMVLPDGARHVPSHDFCIVANQAVYRAVILLGMTFARSQSCLKRIRFRCLVRSRS